MRVLALHGRRDCCNGAAVSEYTKEPWQADRVGDGVMICESSNGLMIEMEFGDEGIANTRRIVACVNACAGATTESLEKHGFLAMRTKQVMELERQRDDLVAALNVELGMWKYDKEYKMSDYSRIHVDMRIEAITAALAKVKK